VLVDPREHDEERECRELADDLAGGQGCGVADDPFPGRVGALFGRGGQRSVRS